ncbi:MAG: SusC/RagA family TonB-linked outer membrane protein [Paludibacteraceae bacterium]|nr:SusC/RagA family TonB-linked outer membrane protein [Paludibacteraceae bacterium]
MKKFYYLLVCLFLIPVGAWAQSLVSGTVYDEAGEPAIGANVVVEGTTTGTVTDFDGFFEITLPAGKKNLVISYLGYKTVTVPAKPDMKVKLETEAQQIQEVVVTGMVKQDKRLFTGATTKLEAEETMLSGVADISRSLEGKAAGVSVQNVSGTFGTAPKIRVRGATSIYGASKPLWVVDGVVLEDAVEMSADDLSSGDAKTLIASAIAGINAEDIESFQILKDGSATSIYGARAMAGVIVVTTKKGQAGKSKLQYTTELTYRMIPSYRDYNICNSQEQMGIYQELERKGWLEYSSLSSAKNSGVYGLMYQLIDQAEAGGVGLENTVQARNAYLRQAEFRNTDWFKELFNQTVMHNHSLSYSAGTDRARVYVSLSAMQDPGWYKSSEISRFTGTANANFDLLPSTSKQKLTAGVNFMGSYRKQKAPGTISSSTDPISGAVSREFDINPFSYAMNTSRAMDPTATYRRNYCDFNIVDELARNYIDIKVTDLKFQGDISYKPVRGLEISALGAVRYQMSRQEHNITDQSNQARAYRAGIDPEDNTIRESNSFLYKDPDDPAALPETVLPKGGIYNLTEYSLLSTDFRATVSYNRDLGRNGDHIISLFGGGELNSTNRQYTWFRGWGYQYENGGVPFTDYRLFKQSQEENSTYFSNEFTYYRNLAFFAMATYSYKGRYTVNGVVRYEGTNKLGKSQSARWLPTWNVSAAWNAHEERWWEPTFGSAWTHASLKASYSLTADRGPSWVTNSLAVFQSYSPYRPNTNASETGIQLYDLENSELTYEKKHELNIGIALGFVDNRINLEFDWYRRNNFDLIGIVQTMGVGGQTEKYANDATMSSTGCEFTLSTVNVKYRDFKWTTDWIFSWAENKITKLESHPQMYSLVSGSVMSRRENYPVGAMFSVPFAGLTEEGLPTFYIDEAHTQIAGPDNYGDVDFQEYDNLDYLKYEGTVDPTITGSFGNAFSWRGIKLNIFFTYSFGNVLRLDPLCYVYSSQYSDLTASMKEMKNRWMVPDDEATTTIPAIATKRQYQEINNLYTAYSAYNYSTERVAKGDFIRLKEISLSYDLPAKYLEGQKAVSNFGVKLTATNIWLAYADKKLNGRDPEFYNTGGVSSPNPRQFTLTIKLGF